MTGSASWRILAIALSLAAIAFVAYHQSLPDREDFGISSVEGPFVRASIHAASVAPQSPGARAGIRTGDVITYPSSALAFARAVFATPGDRVTLTVNGEKQITLVARRRPPAGIPWWITAVRLAFLLVALMLAWRRPGDRAARALFTFLLCFGLALALDSGILPWPLLTLVVMQIGAPILFVSGVAAVAVFAAIFPSGHARRVPRLLARTAVALAIVFAIADVVFNLVPRNAAVGHAATPVSWGCFAAEVALVIATFIVAYRQGPAEERERRRWVSLMLGVVVGVLFLDATLQTLTGYRQIVDELTTIPVIALPFALAYVILRHRVIDVGFVLNRAAVYTLVSAIVVGIFVVVETLASTYFERANRITSGTLLVAVALVVGFSVRYIHERVDRFVDAVLFRQRHAAEAAIRAFGRDAPYVTDAGILLERAVATVTRHTGASDAGIWLYEPPNRYRAAQSTFDAATVVDENDPAIVAMRARGIVVDVAQALSALPGELAFPMIVRGELVGALLCAPKRDGESYAPDERDALASLATSIGQALDTIEVRELRRRLDELTAALQPRP
ncbi:MAG: GAF domain-containing protein [Candidatus Eremiobacteraeota bacterium]|nr:GAF domain-containing protein [Candidatus Eremiobacteraeota bacterium]MBV9262891.1 GAF domain-containing protein [Candidatus Eremiobacteraeota bacterium]